MRSLGDLAWLNSYIGLPYEKAGRSAHGVDCYGLLCLVYEQRHGITLPDWHHDKMKVKARSHVIESVLHGGTWTETEEPQEGGIVVAYKGRPALHLGLTFAGSVLHAFEYSGVIYEPLHRFAERYTRLEFGTWSP